MKFPDVIVAGDGTLLINAVQSLGFITGVTGWQLDRDGNAELGDVVLRGDLATDVAPNPRVVITNDVVAGYDAIVQFFSGLEDSGLQGYVGQGVFGAAGARQAVVTLSPPAIRTGGTDNDRPRLDMFSDSIDGTGQRYVQFDHVDVFVITSLGAFSAGANDSGGAGYRLLRVPN